MKPSVISCALILLLGAGGARLEAQDVASSFDQLAVLVKPGDTISVLDANGRETDGRLDRLSRESLTLITRTGPRELSESEVTAIRQRRPDSLANGAIIGTIAGAACGLLGVALIAADDGGVYIPGAVSGVASMAGLGTAIGVGIDALIVPRRAIYRKPTSAIRITMSPLLGHGRRGAVASVTF